MTIKLFGKIEGVKYRPTFKLPKLKTYYDLEKGFQDASFVYVRNGTKFAVSWWVSPKRTRSYPYARVYDTLQFSEGKIVTIIPVIKDEGADGDRDFLQWDTVALMSLLNVYVILGYYVRAKRNPEYQNKVTDQEFDYSYLEQKFDELSSYRSDALHWNLEQLNQLGDIALKAVRAYENMSKELGVKFHNLEEAKRKAKEIMSDVERFKEHSRRLAIEAQHRESMTQQPKEKTYGTKGMIDIVNYLGGVYHFTVDEVILNSEKSRACLIEAKHTNQSGLPKEGDIKDGLLKMILYTNLKELYYVENEANQEMVRINEVKPILRLTSNKLNLEEYKVRRTLRSLLEEAKINNFEVVVNNKKILIEENSSINLIDLIC